MSEVIIQLMPCRQLQSLLIGATTVGREGSKALLQALRAKAWPHLRELDLSHNDLPDSMVVGKGGLADILEAGGGHVMPVEQAVPARGGLQ